MAFSHPSPVVIPHDATVVARVFDELAAARKGWVNLMPEIPTDVPVPSTPNALAVFSKRGPAVPLGTWTAPTEARNGTTAPAELGVQHGAAARAADTLTGTAGAVPSGWLVVSDHPRRGIVVRAADVASTLDQARWLLDALDALCLPPTTGHFHLFRYEG